MEKSDKGHGTVRHRRVFYIPGYDPIPPRRYRELYRREAAEQAAISGYSIELTALPKAKSYGWAVSSVMDGQQTEARVEILTWSDIVRDSMGSSIAATYMQLLRTAWAYIASGALFRLMKLRKGPVIAALYPLGFLLLQIVIAAGCGAALGAIVNVLAGLMHLGGLDPIPGVVGGLAAAVAILMWFKRHDGRFYAYYLMHDYSFSARFRGANPPALEARLTEFADLVGEALAAGEVDEILVVGHSSGAHLAVSVLADLIRQGRVPEDGPVLSFLSLGQVVPMVSFLPRADRLRADLAYLSTRAEIFWLDVTAPSDGCAFALCDPVRVSGVAPEGQKWPLIISAAFTQTLSPEKWAKLRRRFFRLHFQYLCAFDRPGDYDYFRVTVGPLTLAERFGGRHPSPGRIERAVNRFTSMQA